MDPIRGLSRKQLTLFPEALDDYISQENPVRFIFWGRLHASDLFPHGPIWVIGPRCFEGTNGYLKTRGLKPVIQGACHGG